MTVIFPSIEWDNPCRIFSEAVGGPRGWKKNRQLGAMMLSYDGKVGSQEGRCKMFYDVY